VCVLSCFAACLRQLERVTDGLAGTGESDCEACGPGEYKAESGPTNCLPCPPGTYSQVDTAATECQACPLGSSTEEGAWNLTECSCMMGYTGVDGEICEPCSTGKYKAMNGSSECQACPDNSTSQVLPIREPSIHLLHYVSRRYSHT
jgi:hypothetical protein